MLANRLSSDPEAKVLLVEAGHWARGWKVDMPAALAYPMQDNRLNWGYYTEPQENMNNRRIHWPRGRAVGGSSIINGMVYLRGHARDYNRWTHEGALGWGWADVLPYFRRSQNHASGGSLYRGDDGPVRVRTGNIANALYDAWIDAGREAGYAVSGDINGNQQEGFCRLDMTVHAGRRWSAAKAYLDPVISRKNLTIRPGSLTAKVNFRGETASGVSVLRGGEVLQYAAEQEVILSGGAINSPQILQLSGVGDPILLRSLGISVVSSLAGVGKNLQDHLCVYIKHACNTRDSLAGALREPRKSLIGLRWLLNHTGLGASNHFEAGGFICSSADAEHPDIQYHFMPLAVGYEHKNNVIEPGYQVNADLLRPESRGSVMIRSTDPRKPPVIDPKYLSTESDRRVLRDSIRHARTIFSQSAFTKFDKGELAPGLDTQSDAAIDKYIRETAESAYHPSGTCRMGANGNSVVDPKCRVHGVSRLRVVDASIMPSIVSGNLNGPTFMIAERAADLILGNELLPPELVPVLGLSERGASK